MVSEKNISRNLTSLVRQLLQQLPVLITFLLVGAALVRVVGLGLGSLPSWMELLLERMSAFAVVFLSIVIEAAPFLLLGTLAFGVVEVFIPRAELARWIPRRPLLAALWGSLIGLFIPVGEVGVVPFARSLVDKGVPAAAAAAALLAVPVLNPIVIASTLAVFGAGPIFWGRIVLTFLIAVLTAVLFSAFARPEVLRSGSALIELPDDPALRSPAFKDKLRRALLVMVDRTFAISRYLIPGAGLAAMIQSLVSQQVLLDAMYGPLSSILAMMGMAVLTSNGAVMDSYTANQFSGTLTTPALLAFLVFGPMVDIKNVMMFLHVFRPRAVAVLVVIPLLLTLLITLVMGSTGFGW